MSKDNKLISHTLASASIAEDTTTLPQSERYLATKLSSIEAKGSI